jgi:glycosyltransferase involved in cell wall biosynthesis
MENYPLQNVVHIVNDRQPISMGIWRAALVATAFLNKSYAVKSFLVVCEAKNSEWEDLHENVPVIWLDNSKGLKDLREEFDLLRIEIDNTLVVTHGCWQRPTRLGFRLSKIGYKWIFNPQGMLEPWSLSHHRWKKMIYYNLAEKWFIRRANGIRAVSHTENGNLKYLLGREVTTVENGVTIPVYPEKPNGRQTWLFLARLHKKKGVLLLVKAWDHSMRDCEADLVVAGPDEGELEKIRPYLNGNISYIGPVYGKQKEELLKKSHYYLLPSFSEGFPTSVVEAMSYGAIPLISSGCNFQEVFTNGLGEQMEPDEQMISRIMQKVSATEFNIEKSKRNHEFIRNNYSEEAIGKKLIEFYAKIFL